MKLKMKTKTEIETDQRLADAKERSAEQRLPSFISCPNGIVLRVFKRQQSRIQTDQQRVCAKQRSPSSSVPSFICHLNGMVLQVLNQHRSRLQFPSSADVSKYVLIQKRLSIKSSGIVLHGLKQKQSTLSSSSPSMVTMVTMETKTNHNGAEQRVKQKKRAKQCAYPQRYSHAHHRPPKQQKIKELDYCHHPQLDFCCLGFLDVSNWILIPSPFITRDINSVSLAVLLLRSTIRSFFTTHTLTHTHIQNSFLVLW